MASSTLIIDYLGEGTLASRPAAPVLPTGGLGFYFATDTSQLFLYDVGGAVWILVANPGSGATSRGMTATGNTTGGTSSTSAVISAATFSGAGAASVGFTGGTIIVSVPAAVASGTVGNAFALGHTTGATSSTTHTLSNLSFEGDGGVSVGFSTTAAGAGVVVISGATTAASGTVQNLTVLGNTTAATSSFADTLSARSISATGNVSAGFDTNGVLILSASAAAAATTQDYFALGNTTAATSSATASNSAISISGAGAVSVGLSTTAAGAEVWVVSSPATVASATSMGRTYTGNTAGDSTSTSQAITAQTLSGAGIITVGVSGGIQIISATVGAAGTGNTIDALGNTTGATSSSVLTLGQLSVSGAGGVSVGLSTTGAGAGVLIVSGATTVASGTAENMVALGNTFGATSSSVLTLTAMSVSATGGISAGFSTTGAGAGVLELSVAPPVASATAQNLFALGNTTGATSSTTVTLTGFSFEGDGGVSVGFSTTGAGAGVVVISGATGGAAGATTQDYFALGNTTAATSSATASNSAISFSGAGGVSVGMSTTGAGANVVVISGATGGGGGGSISFTSGGMVFSLTTSGQATNVVLLEPISLGSSLLLNQMRFPVYLFTSKLIISAASSASSRSASYTNSMAMNAIIYSSSAYQAWSIETSGSAAMSVTLTISETGSSFTLQGTYNFQVGSTTASTTLSTTTQGANASFSAGISTIFPDATPVEQAIPIAAVTLPPGANRFLGIFLATATGATGAPAASTGFQFPTPALPILQGVTGGGFRENLTQMGNTSSTIPIGYHGTLSTLKSASFAATDLVPISYFPLVYSMGSFTN